MSGFNCNALFIAEQHWKNHNHKKIQRLNGLYTDNYWTHKKKMKQYFKKFVLIKNDAILTYLLRWNESLVL